MLEKGTYCKDCPERKHQTDNCATCDFCPPELLPENYRFWTFFSMIRGYWIRDGFGKPLTLDWSTVKAIAEMTDYPMDQSEVKKIQSLERISQQYYQSQCKKEG